MELHSVQKISSCRVTNILRWFLIVYTIGVIISLTQMPKKNPSIRPRRLNAEKKKNRPQKNQSTMNGFDDIYISGKSDINEAFRNRYHHITWKKYTKDKRFQHLFHFFHSFLHSEPLYHLHLHRHYIS